MINEDKNTEKKKTKIKNDFQWKRITKKAKKEIAFIRKKMHASQFIKILILISIRKSQFVKISIR